MTAFNRLTAFVLAGLLLLGGSSLITAVVYFPGPYSVTAFDGEQFSFNPLGVPDKLLTGGIGGVLLLAGLLLAALELLGPPSREQLPVRGVEHAEASIARQSVEQRLADLLESLPGVMQATPRVHFERSGTAVDANMLTDPGVAVAPLCKQAQATIAYALEHDLGLQPGPVRVHVRLANRRANKDSAAAPI
jgi:hypothetical protein